MYSNNGTDVDAEIDRYMHVGVGPRANFHTADDSIDVP